MNLDEECCIWDWARAAGVSAAELREALREALTFTKDDAWNDSR